VFFVARSRATSNRSVDILGLSPEFENNYLSEIMPGISVLTTRFGYFGFICWAISKGINPKSNDFRLLEDALAKTEYNCKKNSTQTFKGIRNIGRGSVPPYYTQSIFSDYRKTIEGMGLLTERNELTELGKFFAKLFEDKSKLLKAPRNLELAAQIGFDGVKKSLLRLSVKEQHRYIHIFFNGIKGNPDTEEKALKRKKYKPLYEKLILRREYDIDENGDATSMGLIDLLSEETRRDGRYCLAYEMSQYLSVSYYCMKALNDLYKELRKRKVEKIPTDDAVKIKTVRRCIEEVSNFKKHK